MQTGWRHHTPVTLQASCCSSEKHNLHHFVVILVFTLASLLSRPLLFSRTGLPNTGWRRSLVHQLASFLAHSRVLFRSLPLLFSRTGFPNTGCRPRTPRPCGLRALAGAAVTRGASVHGAHVSGGLRRIPRHRQFVASHRKGTL